MGDFNATPWTTHFSDMLKQGQFENTRAGFGPNLTWPSNMLALLIPIDHILVNEASHATDFGTVRLRGSDHYNVWAKLQISR